ncbi:MAG TPA: hypothetical protein PLO67_23590 [Saprospiraceae bacterium]|nr:hypothetical protein [Saprospiraceae bacterium]HPI09352.1 hypothetical protein [Saprospiraceae bacterium]
MHEAAKTFLVDLLLQNEEIKKFPQDFLTNTTNWVRSWLAAEDDVLTKAVLDSPGNEPLKAALIEQKLPALLQNELFTQQLQNMLGQYSIQKARVKNMVDNATVEVQGNVKIGDKNPLSGDVYDQKNTLKGSTLKAGGDVHIGDEILHAGGNIHFGDIHYHAPVTTGKPDTPASAPIAKELRALIAAARTGEAITKFVQYAEQHTPELTNEILLISTRWESLKRRERMGVVSYSDVNIERNQVNNALLGLIGELPAG